MAHQQLVDAGFIEEPVHDFHAHAHAEFDALCTTIGQRLLDGSLPPNDAYWWARIICTEALTRLSARCRAGQRDPLACDTTCDRGRAAA